MDKRTIKRAITALAESRAYRGQDLVVEVDSDGAAWMMDWRPRRYGIAIAYNDGYGTIRIADERFSEKDADTLDSIVGALDTLGYRCLSTDGGWSDHCQTWSAS